MASQTEYEKPLVFDCEGVPLTGILHGVEQHQGCGIVVIVGGPQYRVGSHRQFVLLARRLADAGIPVLRFDVRGMGDAGGDSPGFESLDADIRSAVDCLVHEVPGLARIALLGLCDGASAGLLYGPGDPRISSLVLLNPWLRSEDGEARFPMRHYYLPRLFQADLWRKALRFRINPLRSLRGMAGAMGRSLAGALGGAQDNGALITRLRRALAAFKGQVLVITSGQDLVGREFVELTTTDRDWQSVVARRKVRVVTLAEANHTMTRRQDLDRAADLCRDWLASL